MCDEEFLPIITTKIFFLFWSGVWERETQTWNGEIGASLSTIISGDGEAHLKWFDLLLFLDDSGGEGGEGDFF